MQKPPTTDPSALKRDRNDPLEDAVADLPYLLTRPEAAGFLRCDRDHVSDLVRSGELSAVQRRVRKGSPMLIPRSALLAYLKRHAR